MRYILAIVAAVLGTALILPVVVYLAYGSYEMGLLKATRVLFISRGAMVTLPLLVVGAVFLGAAVSILAGSGRR